MAPEEVVWKDPRFVDALRAVESEAWNVSVTPRADGFAHDDDRLRSWNASIVTIRHHPWEGHPHVTLHADGRLVVDTSRWDPEESGLGDAEGTVRSLLAKTSDADEATLAGWLGAVAANGTLQETITLPDGHEVGRWRFTARLPPEALHAHRVLDHIALEGPPPWHPFGSWSADFEHDAADAVRPGERFEARVDGNRFVADWPLGSDGQRALEDFHRAYESLGLGPVPVVEALTPWCQG